MAVQLVCFLKIEGPYCPIPLGSEVTKAQITNIYICYVYAVLCLDYSTVREHVSRS